MPYTDGWAKDDLIYKWKEKDPVQVVPGLHLPRFTLEQYVVRVSLSSSQI